jgi:hypothetical protein
MPGSSDPGVAEDAQLRLAGLYRAVDSVRSDGQDGGAGVGIGGQIPDGVLTKLKSEQHRAVQAKQRTRRKAFATRLRLRSSMPRGLQDRCRSG